MTITMTLENKNRKNTMNKSLLKTLFNSSIWALCIVVLLGVSTTTHAKSVQYAKTEGKIKSCPVLYPETSNRSAAKFNVAKQSCWSCPKGYVRSKNPLPDKGSSCKKRNVNKKAKFAFNATWGGTICKGKENWLKNKKCWTCPAGYKRSLKETSGGHPVCKPEKKNKYSKGYRRGNAKKACPAGFIKNPESDSKKNACMRLNLASGERSLSSNANQTMIQNKIDEAGDLIALIDRFKRKLEPVIKRKGIKNLSRKDLTNAGVNGIFDSGCGLGYNSFTITVGGDGAYYLGANADGGIAIGREQGCGSGTKWGMTWVSTTSVSLGTSVGGDLSINVGFWQANYKELSGFTWGIVGGGATGSVGMTASGWRAVDENSGILGDFSGISLGWQTGLSLEAEGNFGYTFQNQTFNNCKDVTVHAINKTGRDIKIIDVDYHDYEKGKWRSEPTPNRKISANGKPYIWKFNLNKVDHAYTQIRVNYRKKKSDGGWTKKVYRDWSAKSICEKGKKYRVNLEL